MVSSSQIIPRTLHIFLFLFTEFYESPSRKRKKRESVPYFKICKPIFLTFLMNKFKIDSVVSE